MATIRPAFMRPIEHITDPSGYDFIFSAVPYVVPSGVYANVISLARAMYQATIAAGVKISSVGMITVPDGTITLGSSLAGAGLTWQNTALRDALGFSGASSTFTSGYATATYLSPYIWVPESHFADQGAFQELDENFFVGAYGITGMLAGISNGDTCMFRNLRFNFELAENIWREFCSTQNQIDRCLEMFRKGAITAAPTISSHPCSKGFWYYQDINEMIADCTATGSQWGDSGGIDFGIGDTYVFCNFVPGGLSDWRKSPGFPIGRTRYHVEVSIMTAPMPAGLL